MNRLQSPRAIARAKWFDDLHLALEDATLLLTAITVEGGGSAALDALQARIAELRTEIELLNIVNNEGPRVGSSCWPMTQDSLPG